MNTKHRMALGVSPLFLRVALAVTFIWAGMVKLRSTMEVDGETAAVLANLGVIKPTTTAPAPDAGTPAKPLPPPSDAPKPEDTGGRVEGAPNEARVLTVAWQDAGKGAPPAGSTSATPQATGTYTAADFPEKVKVKSLYMLAAMLPSAAHPKATPEMPNPLPLWPPALASGRLPVILAWMVTAAELGGGVLVAIGLCTRLGAFSLAGVMAGAMWLTQIGPAVQSGKTLLGFLPDYARYDGVAWTPLLFQFTLFSMALALLFSGPGYLSLDHALFGGRGKHEDHDGE